MHKFSYILLYNFCINNDEITVVGILMKKDLREKVVGVRRKSHRVMAMVRVCESQL